MVPSSERTIADAAGTERQQGEAPRQTEPKLREAALLAAIVESSDDAIIGKTLDGTILSWNTGAELLYGYRAEEVMGKPISLLTPPDHPDEVPHILEKIRRGERITHFETVRLHKDGRRIAVSLTLSPIKESGGEVVGAAAIARDITLRRQAEEALLESNQRYSLLFDQMVVGFALVEVIYDENGKPCDYRNLEVNPAFEKQSGLPRDRIRGKRILEVLPGIEPFWIETYGRVAATGESVHFENYAQPLQKWFEVTAFRTGPGRVGVTFTDITVRKHSEQEAQRTLHQLRTLAARLQSVREEERKRVAREIHDGLGQALTVIKIDLSALIRDLPTDKKQPFEPILMEVDDTIASVRKISTELRPGILDASGLVGAVEWAADEFESRTGIKCRLDLPQDEMMITEDCATALFRIFQETLTNVARHADATEVDVRLAKGDISSVLELHDNGKGITEEQAAAGSSLGILGMRERALLLGGEITIHGVPGKGTTLKVRLPQNHPQQAEEPQ